MIKKYFTLYLQLIRISFAKAANFRFDLYFRTVMDLFYYSALLLFFHVIYGHTPALGGWDESQMHIFLASYFLLDAIDMTVFGTNLWWLPIYINRGDLDLYLTKPVHSLFYLSFKEFQIGSLINAVFSYGLFLYFWLQSPLSLSWWQLLLHHFLLLNGLLLFNFIRLFSIMSCFWSGSPRGLDELFISMTRFLTYPEQIYPHWLRKFFLTFIPFSFLLAIPHQIIFGQKSLYWIPLTLGVTLLVGILAIGTWNLGLRRYSSASS